MSDTPAWASRSPDTIRRWRSAGTAGWRPPSRSAVGSARPPASRPWRRCPRTARSPARCAGRSPATASAATPSASGWCASRNRNPARNRCSGSDRSAPGAPRPGRRRARRRHRRRQARPPRKAAQDGAPAQGWRWSGEVVMSCPRSPQGPRIFLPARLYRSQTGALGKFPNFKSGGGVRAGLGEFVTGLAPDWTQSHGAPGRMPSLVNFRLNRGVGCGAGSS